jgi:signal transduction histidine kinase
MTSVRGADAQRPTIARSIPLGHVVRAGASSLLGMVVWEVVGRPLGAQPFLFLLPAAMAVSWFGGLWPGLVATVIGAALTEYLYASPVGSFAVHAERDIVMLVLFVGLGIGISWLNQLRLVHEESYRAVIARAEEAREAEALARSVAEETRGRFEFLAGASELLAASLDYEGTLQAVARLAVPRIADWCLVHVGTSRADMRLVAVEQSDPSLREDIPELVRRYPYEPEARAGVAQVVRTGAPELIPQISEGTVDAMTDDEGLRALLRRLGLRSSMVVPLTARGRTFGAITLAASTSGRTFGAADLTLAMDLASRAALAVDNAVLYREAVRAGAEREAILENMADGLAIVDPRGAIIYVNAAAREVAGGRTTDATLPAAIEPYQIRTVDGRPMRIEDLPLSVALRERRTLRDQRWRIRRRDGRDVVVEGNAAPIIGTDGELLGAMTVFHDITAQVTFDRQREEFLSSAAHDLKTPLSVVKGMAQIAIRRVGRAGEGPDQAVVHALQRIDAAATRMTGLINELIDSSRAGTDRPMALDCESVDLVQLAREVVQEQDAVSDGHGIVVDTEVASLMVECDRERIRRVLQNVLSNAVKYSPPGTTVRVTVSAEGDAVTIAVADAGVGIPAADLPHVTERFYRGSNVGDIIPGTGIGLAGARQIVEAHGGSLEIESSEGRGTTVTVVLQSTAVARSSTSH